MYEYNPPFQLPKNFVDHIFDSAGILWLRRMGLTNSGEILLMFAILLKGVMYWFWYNLMWSGHSANAFKYILGLHVTKEKPCYTVSVYALDRSGSKTLNNKWKNSWTMLLRSVSFLQLSLCCFFRSVSFRGPRKVFFKHRLVPHYKFRRAFPFL